MGSLLIGGGMGQRGHVYASVGGGLLKTRVAGVDDFFDVSNTDFGVTAGVGAIGFFSDNVGLRGDVRYFRNLGDPEPDNEFDIDFGEFSYWRATAGVAFRV
jgi:opacity protein-like surface antigen